LRTRRARLLEELERVKAIRQMQRKTRSEIPIPTIALVGYTNAGKTTLFNALTGAASFASPILFATLDPNIKRFQVSNRQTVLISDTVGFIQKLPHEVVAAFRATLEEVVQAHLLLHVIDASNPAAEEQMEAVAATIRELGCEDKPMIYVLNKIDLIEDGHLMLQSFRNRLGDAVAISAKTGEGLAELTQLIVRLLAEFWERLRLSVPAEEQTLISMLHDSGKIYQKTYVDDRVEMDVEVPRQLAEKIRRFAIS